MTSGTDERRWSGLYDFVPIDVALAVPRQRYKRDRSTTIYALHDPIDFGVRYVGKTRQALQGRLRGHLDTPTNDMMAEWIDQLQRMGHVPCIKALEYVMDAEWESAERGWIEWFRRRGDLLNVDPGGVHRRRDGSVRGKFVGKYQEPARDHVAAGEAVRPMPKNVLVMPPGVKKGELWARVYKPMGHNSSKRRYISGDPAE